MPCVALDFDGVIQMKPPPGELHGPPVPGALEAIRYLMSKYPVCILTARDVEEVIPWLQGHGFRTDRDNGDTFWQIMGVLLVTNRKIPAAIYVDDRGLRFWSWEQAMQDIEFLMPLPRLI